eukprot:jgi/Mesvir1/21469/Mv03925-RA.1
MVTTARLGIGEDRPGPTVSRDDIEDDGRLGPLRSVGRQPRDVPTPQDRDDQGERRGSRGAAASRRRPSPDRNDGADEGKGGDGQAGGHRRPAPERGDLRDSAFASGRRERSGGERGEARGEPSASRRERSPDPGEEGRGRDRQRRTSTRRRSRSPHVEEAAEPRLGPREGRGGHRGGEGVDDALEEDRPVRGEGRRRREARISRDQEDGDEGQEQRGGRRRSSLGAERGAQEGEEAGAGRDVRQGGARRLRRGEEVGQERGEEEDPEEVGDGRQRLPRRQTSRLRGRGGRRGEDEADEEGDGFEGERKPPPLIGRQPSKLREEGLVDGGDGEQEGARTSRGQGEGGRRGHKGPGRGRRRDEESELVAEEAGEGEDGGGDENVDPNASRQSKARSDSIKGGNGAPRPSVVSSDGSVRDGDGLQIVAADGIVHGAYQYNEVTGLLAFGGGGDGEVTGERTNLFVESSTGGKFYRAAPHKGAGIAGKSWKTRFHRHGTADAAAAAAEATAAEAPPKERISYGGMLLYQACDAVGNFLSGAAFFFQGLLGGTALVLLWMTYVLKVKDLPIHFLSYYAPIAVDNQRSVIFLISVSLLAATDRFVKDKMLAGQRLLTVSQRLLNGIIILLYLAALVVSLLIAPIEDLMHYTELRIPRWYDKFGATDNFDKKVKLWHLGNVVRLAASLIAWVLVVYDLQPRSEFTKRQQEATRLRREAVEAEANAKAGQGTQAADHTKG